MSSAGDYPRGMWNYFHMNIEELQKLVADGVARSDVSERRASIKSTGSQDTVRTIKKGSMPAFDRAIKLLRSLGYRVDISGHDLPAPSRENDNEEILHCHFAAALGLSADASAPEILAAVIELRERAARAAEADARWREVREGLDAIRKDLVGAYKKGIISAKK